MKRTFFALTICLLLLAGSGPVQAQQQNQDYGPGYGQDYGPEGQGWFCPWCGQGRGYGQGPG
ncbi:MAG: hypothetical protein K9K64_11745, partial [Desulfohalobiaceae bacterium]|nr:hypothetical protein [Desulfohalobiaceae bacterium]